MSDYATRNRRLSPQCSTPHGTENVECPGCDDLCHTDGKIPIPHYVITAARKAAEEARTKRAASVSKRLENATRPPGPLPGRITNPRKRDPE